MSMLATIHVIDFEGNRTHGILEYGLVTLKNNTIVDISMASCCKKLNHRMVYFREHSRFPFNEKNKSFEHYLPLFINKRTEGLFCAHGASLEDRLLRQYCITPGIIDSLPEQCNSEKTQGISPFQFSTSTTTESPKSVSWGPWIDTYKIYRKYYPAAECYEVAELIRHFGLGKKLTDLAMKHNFAKALTFHRAPYDALATALLLQNFVNLFRIQDIRFLLDR